MTEMASLSPQTFIGCDCSHKLQSIPDAKSHKSRIGTSCHKYTTEIDKNELTFMMRPEMLNLSMKIYNKNHARVDIWLPLAH